MDMTDKEAIDEVRIVKISIPFGNLVFIFRL